jgi:hypothetical protein
MKKIVVLMLGALSTATVWGMQPHGDAVRTFCEELQGINFNNLVKAEELKKASAAVGKLLVTNNSRAVFIVPSGSKLIGLGLSLIESDVCAKKEPTEGMWGAGALRSSYYELLKFRKDIIDLLEDKRALTWQERFASNQSQVTDLLNRINNLKIPETTWGTWAKSFITTSGEPYKQWTKEYVGEGKPGEPESPFDTHLSDIYSFAANHGHDPVLRAIAHIYRLNTQLLQYMIREKYFFKGPLVTRKQIGVGVALLGAGVGLGMFSNYVCGRWGGVQPAAAAIPVAVGGQ